MNLRDDHQYRVLKRFAPFEQIAFKRTDGSPYRSFLRTPANLVISALPVFNQPTQTDQPPSSSDDPHAQAKPQCCGPDAIEAYHQGRLYGFGDIQRITLPETIKGGLTYFVGHKLQKGRHYDNAKHERMKN